MNLAEAILANFQSNGLISVIPGGVNLDLNYETNPRMPWGIIEDQGGTSEQSSTGDGPTDTTYQFWVFGEPESIVRAAATRWREAIKNAVLELDDGGLAAAAVSSPVRVVTEPDLLKSVQVAFQVNFSVLFQH